jgi:hypothetical protein
MVAVDSRGMVAAAAPPHLILSAATEPDVRTTSTARKVPRLGFALIALILAASCTQARSSRLVGSSAPVPAANWAHEALRIRGVTTDSADQPVRAVEVWYSPCPSKTVPYCSDAGIFGTISDSEGRFSLDLPKPGAYLLIAITKGIIGSALTVELPKDSAAIIRLPMHRSPAR